jgi:hypothetical protein
LSSLLQQQNLKTWIDDTDNTGHMLFSIPEGIKKSNYFVAFLTADFNKKISSGEFEKDWCFRELNYATYILSPKNIVLVVLEEEMKERKDWADPLQFQFANVVYYDMSRLENSNGWPKLLEKLRSHSPGRPALSDVE